MWYMVVVYLLIPTSNHNDADYNSFGIKLYIFWFLHQTTTALLSVHLACSCISFDSYIKPQLLNFLINRRNSCISFDSYIKPQHKMVNYVSMTVVYLLIPTSNHNLRFRWVGTRFVVYLLIPTSNHNSKVQQSVCSDVVYLLIPTSNHNEGFKDNRYTRVVYLLIPTSNHNPYVH